MNRALALALVGIMLAVVAGQAWLLRGLQPQAVNQIALHESRLVAFLQEIRPSQPDTYDSITLNLARLRDAPAQGLNVQFEETVIAEQLLARLAGPAAAPAAPAASAGRQD
ncbi:MAG: hypothetical protein JNJ71_02230 [Rubrivivax sp.]|nr:hypothetical protein [Rubrivivax sp.]